MTLYPLSSNNDPFPQYLTQVEADQFYRQKAINLLDSEIPATIARDTEIASAINSHLAANNPHNITPSLIGAALTSHTHAASAIDSGQLAVANGGTGASTASAARLNLGAAAISHGHFYSDITDKTARWFYNSYLVTVTLGSGWSFYANSGDDFRFYMRELAGTLVTMNGLVKRSASTNNVIFSFHSMYAPKSRKLFICWGSISGAYTPCRVDVTQSGDIILLHPSSTGVIDWVSLDNLIWFNNQ